MRALILVAGAALAVSACSSNEAANNTAVEDNMMTENLMTNESTTVDAATNTGANMAADANAVMNATDLNAAQAQDLVTNTPDTNVANGM